MYCFSADIAQLKQQIVKLNATLDAVSIRLVRSLDKRDHLTTKLLQKFDILTAILKSLSTNISRSTCVVCLLKNVVFPIANLL